MRERASALRQQQLLPLPLRRCVKQQAELQVEPIAIANERAFGGVKVGVLLAEL
jgi:hypothetical protein